MPTFITRLTSPPAGNGCRVAVKDLIDVAGVPTTNGSRVIAEGAGPAPDDADCLAGTRAAVARGNASIVGKANLHELAYGVTGINPWFGTPVNPLDPRLVPGGSSSGSAVAVGAGEADVAFGSDTGGSIRIPAACCGVVGLKTTWGRVSLDGVRPLAPSLDTVGPMARTVAGVVVGMTLLEPGFAPDQRPTGLVGRVRLAAEPRIDDALDRALAAAGLEVREVELPGWDMATRDTMTILAGEAWMAHGDLWKARAGDLSADVAERLAAASHVSDREVAAARQRGEAWKADLSSVLSRLDVLALPTLAQSPPTIEEAQILTGIRYVAPFNLAGVPALSMPVATASGLPASLQLVAPAGGEAVLVALAARVEAAAGVAA